MAYSVSVADLIMSARERANLQGTRALKFIPEEMVNDRKSLDRFLREARPNILYPHPRWEARCPLQFGEGKPRRRQAAAIESGRAWQKTPARLP